MSVEQASPLVERQVQKLVGDMHLRVATQPTAAECFAMALDVAIVCVTFHTMKRGFNLSGAVVTQVLQMSGVEGFMFSLSSSKTLR